MYEANYITRFNNIEYTNLADYIINNSGLDKETLDDKLWATDRICTIMEILISRYKALQVVDAGGRYPEWFEVMILAALMYNIEYDETAKYSSLYKPREKYEKIATELGITTSKQEMIFQIVESANGMWGPVKMKPMPDSPQEMFVLAIWIFKTQFSWETNL